MGPVRIGLSKPSGQVTWALQWARKATKISLQFSTSQDLRTGSSVPPCSSSTAPSDLQTDTPTLSCSSVSLETFSPTPSVLTGGLTGFQVPDQISCAQVPCLVALQAAGVPCPLLLAAQCFPRWTIHFFDQIFFFCTAFNSCITSIFFSSSFQSSP